jgi:hypothetical protein
MADPHSLTAELLSLPTDWRLVKVGRHKEPIAGTGWFDADNYSPDDAASLNGSSPPAWGLKCGPCSGVVVLDLDAEGWRESFQQTTGHPITDLPKTIGWSSGKPGRSGHAFQVDQEWWPHLVNRRSWNNANGETCWELRGDRHQSVVLGFHPETGRYRWLPGCSPQEIPDPAPAPDWLLEALLVQELPEAPPLEPSTDDANRAVVMLQHLPAVEHSSYDSWLRVGMALHHTDLGLLSAWVEWSRSMPSFDEAECLQKWESFGKGHKGQPATIRTLYHLAKQHGYKEPKRKRQQQAHPGKGAQKQQQQTAGEQQTAEGLIRNDENRPPDLLAAGLLLELFQGRLASLSQTLFLYDPGAGYWARQSDEPFKRVAQELLPRIAKPEKDGHLLFPYGSIRHVNDTVASAKVSAGRGPLGGDPPPVLVFRNGTYDARAGGLIPHSPDHGATFGIEADHVPDATCPPELQRVADTCFPEGALPIIRAVIRWLIDPTAPYGQAFHLLGDTGTGKGALLAFLLSFLPPGLVSSLRHPSSIKGPEQLHQFVLGRRLVVFPDCPATIQRDADCSLFFELVENAPQTARRLFASDGEDARPMFTRSLLASVQPLQFRDGKAGFQRRVLTLETLPRSGDPDPTLKDNLVGTTGHHAAIRALAASWALAMPPDDFAAILARNDPEGLLRAASARMAVYSDTVSLWADACLTPSPLGQDAEVGPTQWADLFESYMGWCRYSNVPNGMQRSNFQGQLRRILGPERCLARRKETTTEAVAAGRTRDTRRQLPQLDAGFTVRPETWRQGSLDHTREHFDPRGMADGGLQAIAALPPVTRREAP